MNVLPPEMRSTQMPGQCATYGLKYHARNIASLSNQNGSNNRWLTATSALNEENEIQLLELDSRSEQLKCKGAYTHQHEVWTMACHPSDPAMFCTGFDAGKEFCAKVWSIPGEGRFLKEEVSLETTGDRINGISWKPDSLVVVSSSQAAVYDLTAEGKVVNKIKADPNEQFIVGTSGSNNASEVLVATSGQIQAWDFRSGSAAYRIDKPHQGLVRDIDCSNGANPLLASGGDDCFARIWDPRSLKDPVAAYNHHSHFVWQTRFNPKHEQLLATSSSDSLVTLVNLGERNKARIKPHSRSPSEFSKGSAKKTGPVETFAHDDSVYSIAWGGADEWTLASLSYDGRVAVNEVPSTLKYSILI